MRETATKGKQQQQNESDLVAYTIEYQVHRLSIATQAQDNTVKPLAIDAAHSP